MSIVSKLKFINVSNFSVFCSATSLSSGLTEFCIKWDSININKKSRAKTSDYVSFQFNAVRCVGEMLWPICCCIRRVLKIQWVKHMDELQQTELQLKGTVKKNAWL